MDNIDIRTAIINSAIDVIITLNNEHKIKSIMENERISDFEYKCEKYSETYSL